MRLSKPELLADGYLHVGSCTFCGGQVYSEANGHDPDPRGHIGIHQAASTLVASEYGMQGKDVLMCYACNQERPRYERVVERAKTKIWQPIA